MNKTVKIAVALIIVIALGMIGFAYLNQEEWTTNSNCANCELAESGKPQRLIGTIKAETENKMLFTQLESGKTYYLIPCDVQCDNHLNQWFKQIGFTDVATKQPLYFDIEGKLDTIKQEFLLSSVLLLNEDEVTIKQKYIEPEKAKNQTLIALKKKYNSISEATFPLNEASVSEFRIAIYNHFSETERKQSTPIKEVTWEVNETTLLTIWFIQKENEWRPIEQYQWQKGTEC
ncbi:hypothetical protein EG359_02315 [Chryseobacterium joostei]|uniref:Uncharacterized protein n=1 Tax=Chryseobacterium joostei TaxID=112234 RepID=A0A1N7IMA7_9FLAO|nr:hypothetical protein [Chryseobacterium joostei]AZA98509.1 hypothetical protein EG359_02315 [Chryseobacterium joostei]SIS38126.1 hypothetical protein SAMN05421768_10663 [Chryseobacterium joostei]